MRHDDPVRYLEKMDNQDQVNIQIQCLDILTVSILKSIVFK